MGFLHIYCGDGKGKTTAALGLAVRAAGAGMRVHIIQLLKGSDTAELTVLRSIPGITLERCERDFGFVWNMSEQDKLDITACHNDMLEKGYSLARSGGIDMLIIDEFNAAYRCGLLDRGALPDGEAGHCGACVNRARTCGNLPGRRGLRQ